MVAPLNLSNDTSAGATGTADGMFNDSAWVVNFKSSGSASATSTSTPPSSSPSLVTSGTPGWLYPALAVAAVLWLTRKH